MSGADPRAELAARQAELVAALAGSGPVPEGFDAARLEAAAAALVSKRRQALARAWPVLARSLGAEFETEFAQFAAATPLPRDGSPFADGWAFARRLLAAGRLADEARLELLTVQLHWRCKGTELARRRGLVLRLARLRQTPRLVVALCLPWLGVYRLSLPWFRPRPVAS